MEVGAVADGEGDGGGEARSPVPGHAWRHRRVRARGSEASGRSRLERESAVALVTARRRSIGQWNGRAHGRPRVRQRRPQAFKFTRHALAAGSPSHSTRVVPGLLATVAERR